MSDKETETKQETKERFRNEKVLFENQRRWAKGESGNPAGRPKGSKNRSTILKQFLELEYRKRGRPVSNPLDPSAKSMTIEEAIDAKLICKAIDGDLAAIREIKDTVYGKNPDIVTGDPNAPLELNHSTSKRDLSEAELIAELQARGLPSSIFEK